ncbi:HAD family hydrolase [Donghicola mangrovi]|uniref:HAD family phosphatase n=1 Tax=Donghicola mangrovi TaxID=2729614 RepID=A0A850Q6D5_9RHOB|nr:HAD family phosphatase [Donghicola mangrovi]NVO22115.1 HAD family phosphatase [Donghicola mangrovi]
MPRYDLILFDMDDVLCHSDRRYRAAHLAQLTNTTADRVYAAIWGSGIDAAADAGKISTTTYLREVALQLGVPFSADQWLEARKASMTPNPEVLDLVAQVRKTHQVAVLTNNSELVGDNIDFLFPELRPLFGDLIFPSSVFGAAKPDTQCFLGCLSAIGMTPEQGIFIDDMAGNVAGAQKAGMAGHVFSGHEGLVAYLQEQGVL